MYCFKLCRKTFKRILGLDNTITLKCAFCKIEGKLVSLYQIFLPKMSKNRPVMGRVGHSEFDQQSLHQIKGLSKKFDFQQNTTDFSSFLVIFFWYSDVNFPSIFRKAHFSESVIYSYILVPPNLIENDHNFVFLAIK